MLNLISNLDESVKLEDLRGFNAAVAWFLHKSFEKLGYPSRLVADRNNNIPIADNTLMISAIGMVRMRTNPRYRAMVRRATKRKLAVYIENDIYVGYPYDISFTVPPPHNPKGFVWAGWAADPTHCYPDQAEKAVFLDKQYATRSIRTELAQIYHTYLRVLPTTGAKIYRRDLIIRKMIPWVDVQKIFRKCHFYCCTQYGEAGLTRIEAATCGALLVVPARLYKPRTMGPLPHAIWRNEADLRRIMATKTDPQAISGQARKQTWELVVRRIMARLG